MRENATNNTKFATLDDLFGIPKEDKKYTVVQVPLRDLYPYENKAHTFKHVHPFRVMDDTLMQETVESIKANGVLEPAIVRPRQMGGYEIIAGHRRKRACELAGLTEMPVFIKNLSDDDAAIIMIDTNIYREDLLYSEKAWAYRIKYESMKHQGKKNDVRTADQIGKDVGESGRQIKRYIRLTYLHKELLALVDSGKIKFRVGESISYLSEEEQKVLLDLITGYEKYPSLDAAERMKKLSADGKLSEEQMESILMDKKPKISSIVISPQTIEKYFPQEYTKEDIEKVLIELLEKWNRGQ